MTRYLGDDWVLPALDERSRPFFTQGRLLLQRCEDCGAVQHPPEELCRRCQSTSLGRVEARGSGTIHSFSIVHHPPSPLLGDALPYNVVLVELEDHPHVRITGNLLDAGPDPIRIGEPVHVIWEEIQDPDSGERYLLPQWRRQD